MLFFKKTDDLEKDLMYVINEQGRTPHIFKSFVVAMRYYKKRLDYNRKYFKIFYPDDMYYLDLYITSRDSYLEFTESGSLDSCLAMNLLLNVNQYFMYNNFYQNYVFIGDDYLKLYQKDYVRISNLLKKYELI